METTPEEEAKTMPEPNKQCKNIESDYSESELGSQTISTSLVPLDDVMAALEMASENCPDCGEEAEKIDIKTLIQQSRSDSEGEDTSTDQSNNEEGDEDVFEGANELLNQKIPETEVQRPFVRKLKGRSLEPLKLIQNQHHHYKSHVKKAEKLKTIKFDNVPVFLDAAAEGDLDEVKRLMEVEHVHVDVCNEEGITALHRAAGYGQEEMVKFLLDSKARVNVVDADGWTPLHNAASSGCLSIVKILLAHGANVEAETDSKETPSRLTEFLEIVNVLEAKKREKETSEYVNALYSFDPSTMEDSTGEELAFEEGDKLKILARDNYQWWLAELNDKQGLIPRILVQ